MKLNVRCRAKDSTGVGNIHQGGQLRKNQAKIIIFGPLREKTPHLARAQQRLSSLPRQQPETARRFGPPWVLLPLPGQRQSATSPPDRQPAAGVHAAPSRCGRRWPQAASACSALPILADM